MKRPSKKEIRAAVDKLKDKNSETPGPAGSDASPGRLSSKKSSMRIRKQGV